MSPLVSPPNRGYGDWQRVGNFDSGMFYSQRVANGQATFTAGPFDCSRYAYLGGIMSAAVNPVQVTITWSADQAGQTILGQRQFCLHPSITNGAQIRLPNLGPWVSVTLTEISGLTFGYNLQLFGTNRVHPLEFVPTNQTLIPWTNTGSLGAGGQLSVYPGDYYAGPVQLAMSIASAKSWVAYPEWLRFDGNWVQLAELFSNGQDTLYTLSVPPGAWHIRLANNTGGNDSMNVSVWHPTTGAV